MNFALSVFLNEPRIKTTLLKHGFWKANQRE